MTKSESDFIAILKNIVHPTDDLYLDNPDGDEIIAVATRQNLFPLIFDAVESLPGFEAVKDKYFIQVAGAMGRQMQKTSEFLDLYKNFLSDGLSPIVMKGIICRSLYEERGDFRASGDEDILVTKDEYAQVVHTLNRCGYYTSDEPDSELETVQEVTFAKTGSPLEIELHLNPFGTVDNIRTSMNEWFKDAYASKEIVEINGVPVRTLEPTDHLLFLIFHSFKHFIFGGFGVRLMLDILLFAEKYDLRIDWDYIKNGLKAVGADGFYTDMVFIGNRHLGFNLPLIDQINTPDELLDDMLRMGTFGNLTTADHVAAMFTADAVQKGSSGSPQNSKFRSMMQRLFPSWQSWTAWHPYLKDKPLMLPVEWFKRLIRYVRGQADMGSMEEINESYSIAERRLDLLRKYKVI